MAMIMFLMFVVIMNRLPHKAPVRDDYTNVDFLKMQHSIDDEILKNKQKIEDNKIKYEIERAANDMYIQWLDVKLAHGNSSLLLTGMSFASRQTSGMYIIHHSKTARYHKLNINDLIREKFNKLKESK
jgi:low affinity Fe/Cu permease